MRRSRVFANALLLLLLGYVAWFTPGCSGCCPTPEQPKKPQPGPTIDSTGDSGNNLTYSKNQVAIPTTPANTGNKLDPDFFLKAPILRLIRTSSPAAMWSVVQFKVRFSDGRSFEGVRDPGTQKIQWTCYDSSNAATVLQAGVEQDHVPECMLGTLDSVELIRSTAGGQNLQGHFIHIETELP